MEFRCRLAAASGEITEGQYVADSEARLRHELEEKGLYVLSLQAKGALPWFGLSMPRRTSVPSREFLVFNQELATLLKAGMPLVQSLDLLKQRVDSPVFKRILEDVYERVRSGSALSDAFAAHGSLLPSIYTASLLAGERSGSLDAVLRRFVEYSKTIATVKRKTVSALVYPVILISLAIMLVSIIVLKVVPAFSDFYAVVRRRTAAHHQDHRPHLRRHASAVRADSAGARRRRRRLRGLDSPARPAGTVRQHDPADPRSSGRWPASSRPLKWRGPWRRC